MNPPRRNRGWIWYFVVLVFLTAAAVGILVTFNLRQQLKAEQVEAARRLWEAKGPANYDMVYTQKGNAPGTFRVQVRNKKPISVIRDGQPLEARLYRYSDMPALFGFIEDSLKNDAQPGKPGTYTIATFDPDDGHLIHYVRRAMGGTERIEITVELHPVSQNTTPLEPKKASGPSRRWQLDEHTGRHTARGLPILGQRLSESVPRPCASSLGLYVPLWWTIF
jgi:hypothetical protein